MKKVVFNDDWTINGRAVILPHDAIGKYTNITEELLQSCGPLLLEP